MFELQVEGLDMEVESVEPGSSGEQPDSSLLRQEQPNSSQFRQEQLNSSVRQESALPSLGEAEKRRRAEEGAAPNKRLKSEEAEEIQ